MEASSSSQPSRSRRTSIYEPLETTTRQIRLLSFRERAGATLSCRLKVYDLEEAPPFIALSYTWGLEHAQQTIRVNASPFSIRENLRTALDSVRTRASLARQMREESGIDPAYAEALPLDKSPERWKHFWIDAVCINQRDISERNDQVAMMRDIYSNASFVLVWLGNECEGSLDYLREKRDTAPEELEYYADDFWSNPPYEMENLIYADYWSRMWIVQEFVLAKTLIIAAGHQYMHWDTIEELFPRTEDPNTLRHYSRYYSMNLVVQERYELDQRREDGFFRSLEKLLIRFTDSECSDQRDKIFALIGLFSDSTDAPDRLLQADYELREWELYLEVIHQARRHLSPGELWDLRIYVSSALEVDPDECERMARRVRRGSQASRRGWRRGGA